MPSGSGFFQRLLAQPLPSNSFISYFDKPLLLIVCSSFRLYLQCSFYFTSCGGGKKYVAHSF